MKDREYADYVAVRLGRESKVATWGWCELVTHPAACHVRDEYVSATALGIAMRLGGDGRDAYPSLRTLSDRLSLSRRVVSRSVWALEAGGWLEAVGNGPRGTIRWSATVPLDLYRVMENAHYGDGLPWVELHHDERVQAAVVEAFGPVADYVEASKRDRESAVSTTGATEGPVVPTTGATEGAEGDEPEPEDSVVSTVGATGEDGPDPVVSTVGTGVVSTVGTGTSRDPTNGYYEKGSKGGDGNEAVCVDCGSPRHRWCGKAVSS